MRSRVIPGSLVTMERRAPVSRLKSVDLPTFGRPTKTSDGSLFGIRIYTLPYCHHPRHTHTFLPPKLDSPSTSAPGWLCQPTRSAYLAAAGRREGPQAEATSPLIFGRARN